MATALLECSVASTAEPMQVVREKSTFRIALLNVPVVEASLALEPDSTGAILVEGRARTVGIGGILYPIDNYYRALLDPTSGLPRWWKKTIAQADLKQSLAARADRELGLVDYGEHGTRQLAEGASWFIAIGATLHREVWEVGTCRTYPIEMEGRRLMMTLRGREEVERKVLGRTRRCIVVEAELVDLSGNTWAEREKRACSLVASLAGNAELLRTANACNGLRKSFGALGCTLGRLVLVAVWARVPCMCMHA